VTLDELWPVLQAARTVAVVGLSPNPSRPSHSVARYLQRSGYRIVPVNPNADRVLDERSYPSLTAAAHDHTLYIVDVFRRSEHAALIVREAIPLAPRLIWLQEGIIDPAGAALAQAAGIPFVMDHCLAVEHERLSAQSHAAE
jgi:predicted CoA-binding protein